MAIFPSLLLIVAAWGGTHAGLAARVVTSTVQPHSCSGNGCEYVDMATCSRLDDGAWRCNTVHSKKIHTNTTVACEGEECKIHTEATLANKRVTPAQFVAAMLCVGVVVALVGPWAFVAILVASIVSDNGSDRTITTTTH